MSDPIVGLVGAPTGYVTLMQALTAAMTGAGADPAPRSGQSLTAHVLGWLDPVLEAADVLPVLWREIAAGQLCVAPPHDPSRWGPMADERVARRLATLLDLLGARHGPQQGQQVAWESMVLMHTGAPARNTEQTSMIDRCRGISPFAHDMGRVRTALLSAAASGDELGDLPARTAAQLSQLLHRLTDEQIRRNAERAETTDERVRVLTTLLRSLAGLRLPVGPIGTRVPDVRGVPLKLGRSLLGDFALACAPVDAVQAPPQARQPRLEGSWIILAQHPAPGVVTALDSTVSVFFAKPKETANPALLPTHG